MVLPRKWCHAGHQPSWQVKVQSRTFFDWTFRTLLGSPSRKMCRHPGHPLPILPPNRVTKTKLMPAHWRGCWKEMDILQPWLSRPCLRHLYKDTSHEGPRQLLACTRHWHIFRGWTSKNPYVFQVTGTRLLLFLKDTGVGWGQGRVLGTSSATTELENCLSFHLGLRKARYLEPPPGWESGS